MVHCIYILHDEMFSGLLSTQQDPPYTSMISTPRNPQATHSYEDFDNIPLEAQGPRVAEPYEDPADIPPEDNPPYQGHMNGFITPPVYNRYDNGMFLLSKWLDC